MFVCIVCMYAYVRMNVCMCLCMMRVCECVCMHVCIYVYGMYTNVFLNLFTCMNECACMSA